MFSLLCNKVFRAWLLPLTFISFSDPFLRVISYLGGLSPAIDHGYSTNTYGPSSLCAGVPLNSWRWAVSASCWKNLTRSRIALCSRYRSATDSGTYPFNFVRFQRWSIIYRSNVFTGPNNSSAGVHPVVEWYHSSFENLRVVRLSKTSMSYNLYWLFRLWGIMDVYPYNLEVRIDSIICLLYAAVVSNYFATGVLYVLK